MDAYFDALIRLVVVWRLYDAYDARKLNVKERSSGEGKNDTSSYFWHRWLAIESGSHPDFDTHPDELEKKAKETLSKGGWLYASCNAGVSWTHDANREGERELSGARSLYQRFIDIVSSRACCATPPLETRQPSCSDTR